MNPLTLSFKIASYEKMYRKQSYKQQLTVFKPVMLTLVVSFLISSFYHFIFGVLSKGFVLLGMASTLFTVYMISMISYNFFDWSNFIFSIIVHSINNYYLIFNIQTLTSEKNSISPYYIGQYFAYFHIVILFGTRFYLKIFTIIMGAITLVTYLYIQDQDYEQFQRIIFLLSVFLFIVRLYYQDKIERLAFILKQQKIQQDHGLNTLLDIGIMEIGFKKQSQQLYLKSCNQYAQHHFKLKQNLQAFLRQVHLLKQLKNFSVEKYNIYKFIRKCAQEKKQQQKTLEQVIFYLFKKSAFTIDHSNQQQIYHYQGSYNKQIVKVTFYLVYDIKPSAFIIFDRQQNEEKLLKLQEANNTQSLLIQKQLQTCLKTIKPILLFFQRNEKLSCNQIIEREHEKWYYQVKYKSYVNFNNMVNVYCFSNELIIRETNFSIRFLLDELIKVFQPKIKLFPLKIKIKNHLQDDQVYQCYWMLYHCLFNLLSNSIENAPKNTQIMIRLFQTLNIRKQTIIKIEILDLGLTVLQKQLDKLPVINPLYLSDYYINHEKDNIPLGLSISNYIISLIGPYKYIKIIEKENHKMVQFKIYQNLQDRLAQNLVRVQRFQPQIEKVDQETKNVLFKISNLQAQDNYHDQLFFQASIRE